MKSSAERGLLRLIEGSWLGCKSQSWVSMLSSHVQGPVRFGLGRNYTSHVDLA